MFPRHAPSTPPFFQRQGNLGAKLRPFHSAIKIKSEIPRSDADLTGGRPGFSIPDLERKSSCRAIRPGRLPL
jgi:hypothetical protein